MTRKTLTSLLLFKALCLTLVYISITIAWLFFAAPSLISSSSTIEVVAGLFGTACWLIVSTCLYFKITHKPSQLAKSSEKTQ